MDCDAAQEVLSAHLDQEAGADEVADANEHLESCPSCRTWWAEVSRLNRALRIRPAEPVPDLTAAVLARAHPPRLGRGEWIRFALFVVAATDMVMALPGLLLGEGAATVHDGRHLGSFGVAVSIGLLYVAWRPVRAYGILPIVGALAATMLLSAAIDVAYGRVSSLGEAHHVLDAFGLLLVWLLAGRPMPKPHRRDDASVPPRHERSVHHA